MKTDAWILGDIDRKSDGLRIVARELAGVTAYAWFDNNFSAGEHRWSMTEFLTGLGITPEKALTALTNLDVHRPCFVATVRLSEGQWANLCSLEGFAPELRAEDGRVYTGVDTFSGEIQVSVLSAFLAGCEYRFESEE